MPYPVLLAVGAALSAAGTASSMAAQGQARSNMNRARDAESERQKGYQKRAEATYGEAEAKAGRQTWDETQDAAAASREAQYGRLANVPVGGPSPIAKNQVVQSPVNRAQDTAYRANNAWNSVVAPAQATLGGSDEAAITRSVQQRRTNEQLANVGQEARRSADLLNWEMQDASHSGDSLAQAGSLLSAAGMVAGTAGNVGIGPSFGGSGSFKTGNIADSPVSNPWNNVRNYA